MKKTVLLFMIFSIFSCSEKIEKPEKFLDKEEMTNLLYELSLLSSSRSYVYKDSVFTDLTPLNVLVKYNLDSISFVDVNNYYIKQPKVYSEIYDSVNKRLQRKIKEIEALPEDPRDTLGVNFVEKFRNIKLDLK